MVPVLVQARQGESSKSGKLVTHVRTYIHTYSKLGLPCGRNTSKVLKFKKGEQKSGRKSGRKKGAKKVVAPKKQQKSVSKLVAAKKVLSIQN